MEKTPKKPDEEFLAALRFLFLKSYSGRTWRPMWGGSIFNLLTFGLLCPWISVREISKSFYIVSVRSPRLLAIAEFLASLNTNFATRGCFGTFNLEAWLYKETGNPADVDLLDFWTNRRYSTISGTSAKRMLPSLRKDIMRAARYHGFRYDGLPIEAV